MKVYLSGCIAGFTYDEANVWRETVTDVFAKVGIATLNPLRRRLFYHADDEDGVTPAAIVQRDVADVRDSDILLIVWSHPSIGTACELWEAYREGKPIILVTQNNTIRNHPWVRVCVTRIFSCISDATKYICDRAADMNPDGLPEMWEHGGEG